MRLWWSLVLLAFLPGAQACSPPLVQLDLDPTCEAASDCDPMPRPGESLTVEGVVHYRVQMEEPCDRLPRDDVVISLWPSDLEPSWLTLQVEPSSIDLPLQEIYDARHAEVEGTVPGFSHSWPVTATVTGLGAPNATEVERASHTANTTSLFVKVHATSEGIPDTFGTSELRFDMRDALPTDLSDDRHRPEVRSASPPILAWLIIGPALLAAVLAGRRFIR